MIGWAITFAILALIAGILGFGVLASSFAVIAKIFLGVFLFLFILALLVGRSVTGGPTV
jgi:uncharacterized membrane protein YtjA (UPF0391 family)